MLYVLLPMFVVAQQERSFEIDEESFVPEQKGVLEGVDIDKIAHDYSNRPCARIKLHINRMSREDISQVSVKTVGGNVVIMKSEVATEGNGLIIELTARPNVRLYLHHDKYGDSNEVTLNLEADKVYKLEAQLSLQYSIVVSTNFVGADVYIDDTYVGKSDETYGITIKDVMGGLHKVRVEHGAAKEEKEIEVSSSTLSFRVDIDSKSSRPQYVVFEVEPKEAIVVIDQKEYFPDDSGYVSTQLYNGSHSYRVWANDYHEESGTFMVEGDKLEKRVVLNPAFGYLSIESSLVMDGANVFIDDKHIGKAPLKSDKLSSGTHKIKILKDLYKPFEEVVTIQDGEELKYAPVLVADYATVTLTAEDDADIYVNDRFKAKSVWSGNLATGTYIFEARKDGHYPTIITETIEAGKPKDLKLTAPTPILGMLDLHSKPMNVSIYVDGEHIGETPLLADVLIGDHVVTFKKRGYADKSEFVTIVEGEVMPLKVDLKKSATATEVADDTTTLLNLASAATITDATTEISSHSEDVEAVQEVVEMEDDNDRDVKRLTKRSCFYISGEYQFVGLSGIRGDIGGYIKNFNIEANILYSFKSSETIYWYNTNDISTPYSYTYKPIYYGGRLGYGINIGKRLRITPQIGAGVLSIIGDAVEEGKYGLHATDGYCIVGVGSLKLDLHLTPFMAITVTPNYSMPFVKSSMYSQLYGASPTFKRYVSGFSLSAGLCFCF